MANSEILRVTSSSQKDAQPVSDTIVHAGLTLFPDATISIALQVDDEIQTATVAGPDPTTVDAWWKPFPAPAETGRNDVLFR